MFKSITPVLHTLPADCAGEKNLTNSSIISRDNKKGCKQEYGAMLWCHTVFWLTACRRRGAKIERAYRGCRDRDLAECWVPRGQCQGLVAGPRWTGELWLGQWRTDRTAVSTDHWDHAAASQSRRNASCTASADDSAAAQPQTIDQSISPSVSYAINQ